MPRAARWYAALAPMTPPPIITMSAEEGISIICKETRLRLKTGLGVRCFSFNLFDAQIRLADHLVILKILRRIREEDLAGLNHITAIGNRKSHQRILFYEQNRCAFFVDGD